MHPVCPIRQKKNANTQQQFCLSVSLHYNQSVDPLFCLLDDEKDTLGSGADQPFKLVLTFF